MIRAALVLAVALGACGPHAVEGPTRHVRPIPAAAYASYTRGRLAVYERRYADAVDAFTRALQIAPDEPELHAALIESLALADRVDEARARADAAVAVWPKRAVVWRAVGRAAYRARDWDAAARAFARATELAPRDEAAHLRLAEAHRRRGDWDAERRAYRQLLARLPDSVRGHYRLGARLLDRDTPDAARAALERAVTLEPDHIGARIRLADALWATGAHAAADHALRDAFDRTGGSVRVARRIVDGARTGAGRARAAAVIRLLDRDDLNTDARIALGAMAVELGAYPTAVAIARAVLATTPAHAGARRLLGVALMRWLGES